MPACKVCTHKQRTHIEKALVRGDSQRSVASQHSVSPASVQRHVKNGHVAKLLTKAELPVVEAVVVEQSVVEANANSIMQDLLDIKFEAMRVLDEARDWRPETKESADGAVVEFNGPGQKDRWAAQLQAIGAFTKVIETIGKVTGELAEKHLHVHTSPEWLKIREVIIKALAPFPEAKAAVSAAIQAENGNLN